jgi:hypothetical protein
MKFGDDKSQSMVVMGGMVVESPCGKRDMVVQLVGLVDLEICRQRQR